MDGEARAVNSFSGDPLNLSPGAKREGCVLMEWTDQRTGAGPQGWCVAKYSQMLTALGHSPDILGETERPGGGQWSQEPEPNPSSSLFAFTVDQCNWSTLESQGPHDKTRRHEKKVRVTTLGLGALPAGLRASAAEEAELQQAMLPCPPLPSPALSHPPVPPPAGRGQHPCSDG